MPLLHKGDIIFGEAGFQKGKSVVLTEEIMRCTTNAHGLFARCVPINMKKSYFFRCIFDWYRRQGLIDLSIFPNYFFSLIAACVATSKEVSIISLSTTWSCTVRT